jgi:hypothetical protein
LAPYSIPRGLVEPLDLDFLEYSPAKEHCDGNSSVDNSATEQSPAEPTTEQVIQSLIDKCKAPVGKENSSTHSARDEGTKQVEEANKALKKLAVTLAFTGPIEEIFGKAGKATSIVYLHSWELIAEDQMLREILTAARRERGHEDGEKGANLLLQEGYDLKGSLDELLKFARRDALNVC